MSALIKAGATVGSSLINNLFAGRQAKKQRQHQRKMADYTYQKDLEMWERANKYNSPAQQMKRLKAAGLNPNLVYGKGAVGNAPATIPQHQKWDTPVAKYSVNPGDIPRVLGAFQDLRMKEAQIDNIKAQADIAKTEAFMRSDLLKGKSKSIYLDNLKRQWETGQMRGTRSFVHDWMKTSPHAEKYQAQTKAVKLNNMLRGLDRKLKKQGVSWSDSALMRLFIMNKLSDSDFMKLAPFHILGGLLPQGKGMMKGRNPGVIPKLNFK